MGVSVSINNAVRNTNIITFLLAMIPSFNTNRCNSTLAYRITTNRYLHTYSFKCLNAFQKGLRRFPPHLRVWHSNSINFCVQQNHTVSFLLQYQENLIVVVLAPRKLSKDAQFT